MMKNALMFALLILCGCSAPTKKSHVTSPYHNQILGWWYLNNQLPINVKKDSIEYFPEHYERYAYSLEGDTITIFCDDTTYTATISFIKDTLVMTDKKGSYKYHRAKH